jgi:hypothetical protein
VLRAKRKTRGEVALFALSQYCSPVQQISHFFRAKIYVSLVNTQFLLERTFPVIRVAKWFSVLLILGALGASKATAQVGASSCSTAAVQSAINSASEGQTVTIPAGTCTWTSGVTISGKGIALQGAGSGRIIAYDNGSETLTIGTGTVTVNIAGFSPGFSASSISNGETLRVFENNAQTNWMQGTVVGFSSNVLTMNITSTGGSGTTHRWLVATMPSTVIVDNDSSGPLFASLSGIQIATGSSGTASVITLGYKSGGVPILIHDNWFQQMGGEMIDSTTNRGVIWNNSFNGSTGNSGQLATTAAVRIKGAPISWTSPSTWGAADTTGTNSLYVETNDFHALQGMTDNDDNGKMVFRYNLVDHSTFGTHGADTSDYGQRYFEYYNNTGVFYGYSDGSTFNVANGWVGLVRGGTFVMFDNNLPEIVSQDYGTKADVLMVAMNLQRDAGPNPCWGAGYSTPGQYYHVPRQVGFGYVTGAGKVTNSIGTLLNAVNDAFTYVGDSEPAYMWGNSRQPLNHVNTEDYGLGQSNSCPSSPTPDSSVNYIVAGRDYFNGSTPKPGYTPYTYPHPLASGSGSGQGSQAPAAPTNLTATVE